MVGGVLRGARESFIEFGGVFCGRKKAGKRCTKGSIFVLFFEEKWGVLEEEAE